MTLTDLNTVVTVLSFLCFIALMMWAFGSRQKSSFDEAAQLPFEGEDDLEANSVSHSGAKK